MKKLIALFIFMFMLLGTLGLSASASETTTEETLPNAGLKPSDAFYGFDKFFENIALRFTFSNEKKAEKLSKIACERLAELNELDEEKANLYADELFNEYGLSLEKANLYVQKLVAEGKLSEEKLAKIEAKVARAEELQEKIKEKAKEKISKEVKDKVTEAIKQAKMSIFNRFTDQEAMKNLHDEGYGYGQLIKLQAIAELSNKSISDLLLIEGVASTNEENEKIINFDTLLEAVNLSTEDLKTKLTEYKDNLKETLKTKMSESDHNCKTRREEVKSKISEKVNEIKTNKNK